MKSIKDFIAESAEFKFAKKEKVGQMINSFSFSTYTTKPEMLPELFSEENVKKMSKRLTDDPEKYNDIWGVHSDDYYYTEDKKALDCCWDDFCKYIYPMLDTCLQYADGKNLKEFCKALETVIYQYINPSYVVTVSKSRYQNTISIALSNSEKESNLRIEVEFK